MGGGLPMQPFLHGAAQREARFSGVHHRSGDTRSISELRRVLRRSSGDVLERAGVLADSLRTADRFRQSFKFTGKRAKFGGESLGIRFPDTRCGVKHRVEQHCQARQDRLFDPFEGIVQSGLQIHCHAYGISKLG